MRIKQFRGWLLFLVMALVPFLASLYYVNILTEIFILAVFAVSLNILVGQTGLVSLGHAAFFGAGAYATGLVASHVHANVFLTIGIGMLVAALLALVVGFLSIKAYGFYFLMLTLGLFADCLFDYLSVDTCNWWFKWFIWDSSACTFWKFRTFESSVDLLLYTCCFRNSIIRY